MMDINRRTLVSGLGSVALAAAAGMPVRAQNRTSVRIGYIASKSGIKAPGTTTT